jgi:hypothetical protein
MRKGLHTAVADLLQGLTASRRTDMPIDTSPEGAELLHQPVVKPFPEFSPKDPHHAHHAEQVVDDGHNQDAGTPAGGLIPPPPG